MDDDFAPLEVPGVVTRRRPGGFGFGPMRSQAMAGKKCAPGMRKGAKKQKGKKKAKAKLKGY